MEQEQSSARRRFTPEEKFRIVKEQLTTKTSVSEICRKYGISPGNFYSWQELFFSGAMAGFDKKRGPKADVSKANQRAEQMESEISRMREVIAEITAENIGFKKSFRVFRERIIFCVNQQFLFSSQSAEYGHRTPRIRRTIGLKSLSAAYPICPPGVSEGHSFDSLAKIQGW